MQVIEIVDKSLEKSNYVIAVNGSIGQSLNQDIDVGGYRALDLSLPPFNYVVEELLVYLPSRLEVNKVVQRICSPKLEK